MHCNDSTSMNAWYDLKKMHGMRLKLEIDLHCIFYYDLCNMHCNDSTLMNACNDSTLMNAWYDLKNAWYEVKNSQKSIDCSLEWKYIFFNYLNSITESISLLNAVFSPEWRPPDLSLSSRRRTRARGDSLEC
jgi:hypothetical protein